MSSETRRISPERLAAWSTALLMAGGVPRADADVITDHLIFADLRGIDTHGTSRLKIYLTRVAVGAQNPVANIRVLRESPVSALLDGGHGFGHPVHRKATEMAIEKAQKSGMAAVGVYNSNHSGCMAYYTMMMARAGLIGFSTVNAPANMPPFGGMAAFFGTNPFSMAAPTSGEPFVFDMATSQVARGKIINAAREGKPIPEGWAITRDGRSTTDSKEALAGFVLPMGGVKGSALAFMVEILSGVLTGAAIGPALPVMYGEKLQPQLVGHFVMAFRPDLFMEQAEFIRRMDETLAGVRAVTPAPGFDKVLAPGDVELARAAENRRLGIPITPGVQKEFVELAAQYQVPLPTELVV